MQQGGASNAQICGLLLPVAKLHPGVLQAHIFTLAGWLSGLLSKQYCNPPQALPFPSSPSITLSQNICTLESCSPECPRWLVGFPFRCCSALFHKHYPLLNCSVHSCHLWHVHAKGHVSRCQSSCRTYATCWVALTLSESPLSVCIWPHGHGSTLSVQPGN